MKLKNRFSANHFSLSKQALDKPARWKCHPNSLFNTINNRLTNVPLFRNAIPCGWAIICSNMETDGEIKK